MTLAVPMPTDQMKFRVSGDTRDEIHIQVGLRSLAAIRQAAEAAGRPIKDFKSVLDFGCGCGRVLRAWPIVKGQSVSGTDIDEDAIGYCREAFPQWSFRSNGALPPADFAPAQFDLIYSISVFSHLREDYALPWIAELRRLAAPGALLIITLTGMHLRTGGRRSWRRLLRPSVVFEPELLWDGHFPPWYGNLFLSESAARKIFGKHFKVERFIPRGLNGHQDVIVLRA